MRTTKIRTKKRGLNQKGLKLNGTECSLDMCPCCLSFGCDPMTMSPAFSAKIHERFRKKCCPSCGEPKDFCKCRNTTGPVKSLSHNNKKLKAARKLVQDKETAFRYWKSNELKLVPILGEETYQTVMESLFYHDTPELPWGKVEKLLATTIELDKIAPGWASPSR